MESDKNQGGTPPCVSDEAVAIPPDSTPVAQKRQPDRNRRRGKLKGAQKVLESMAFDPIAAMAVIAGDPNVDVALRAKLLMELAQYVYPKRKGDQAEEGTTTETYEQRLMRIRALADEAGVY
ncbi:MAG: hypothetical protein SFH39_18060 [Candidatus Magnetobacterium sp. LHC-1]|nr:hypothetical protein [Nitrospirota bacterium]